MDNVRISGRPRAPWDIQLDLTLAVPLYPLVSPFLFCCFIWGFFFFLLLCLTCSWQFWDSISFLDLSLLEKRGIFKDFSFWNSYSQHRCCQCACYHSDIQFSSSSPFPSLASQSGSYEALFFNFLSIGYPISLYFSFPNLGTHSAFLVLSSLRFLAFRSNNSTPLTWLTNWIHDYFYKRPFHSHCHFTCPANVRISGRPRAPWDTQLDLTLAVPLYPLVMMPLD